MGGERKRKRERMTAWGGSDVRFMGGLLPRESFVLLSETQEEWNTNPLNPVTHTHTHKQDSEPSCLMIGHSFSCQICVH